METQLNQTFVASCKAMNEKLKDVVQNNIAEYELQGESFTIDLLPAFVSEDWSLKKNIEAMLTCYSNTYGAGIKGICESRTNRKKHEQAINFLKNRGLLEEYKAYTNQQK